jgi:serine protease Do
MTHKHFWIFVLIAFIVGGIASVAFDRALIPALANIPGLAGLRRLTTDSPIVINRREQVQIDQGVNLIELAKQAGSFTVSIYTGQDATLKLAGSGIILTSDGVIMTSRNILGDAKEATVVLNDGHAYPALVRALDRKSPVAVLTIVVNNLNVAQFEDANNLAIGERIFALGKSTAELSREFTTGSVTKTVIQGASLDQTHSTEAVAETFGTTASFGADFVGGPIINVQGRVVGMVADANGGVIASESLNQDLSAYLSTGKITRPYAGITYLNFSKTLAQLKGYTAPGVLVTALADDSPAKKAGLKVGDYIVSVDGSAIENTSFERLINRHAPGNVKLSAVRGQTPVEINFQIENK